ncbi:iron-sulfur cluster assembly scaffold protein [Novosphingobium sp.]|uniref:iron-sulfur cluster assembly scaffold protein n=1 Tax=Novosphingobium sp. TaxID=1874826 RepID=UPI0025DF336C|nr:iron-sulfur cluster assembly scaffold protein [Novosphingobium sp.]MCC6924326.1 iron-sulfur cluster assembly scaffold protein [Novosphingobium sp.]
MSSATALYTPQVLALATSLARYPLGDGLPLSGSARSPTCGSTIELGLHCDTDGQIDRIGLRAHACAIGQAAAAIFVEAAKGKDDSKIRQAYDALEAWLAGGDLPDWPGIDAIAAARDFPARHGAILLAWRAALVALEGAR